MPACWEDQGGDACGGNVPQVDYAAAGIFLNVTTDSEDGDSAPWWQLEGSMAPGLEALTPVYERFSPHWWFPDVPKQAIGSIKKLENVLPFLRQVREHQHCVPITPDRAHMLNNSTEPLHCMFAVLV